MRIMYIDDVGFDSQNGTNHLICTMLLSFLREEHSVYYIVGHSDGINPDIPIEFNNYSNFEYDIINKKAAKRTNLVKRFLNSIKFEYDAKKRWKKKINDIDVVIIQSHYTAFITSKLLRKYNKKIVFNVYDIFPGISFASSGMPNRLVYNFFLKKQQKIYANCNIIITLTEDTKTSLLKLGVSEHKIRIVPNWYDETMISGVNQFDNSFAKEFNMKPGKFYIQYAGTLGVSYDFEAVLKVAELLIDRKDIVFQLVGNGYKLDMIKRIVEEKKLTNVVLIPWQPINRLSEVYSSCTLQIVPLNPEVIFNSYPSKILPLMGCKRTALVFADKNSHFYEEANRIRFVKCVPIGDYMNASCFIKEFCDDSSLRKEYEKNAFEYAKKKFMATENVKKIVRALNELVEE